MRNISTVQRPIPVILISSLEISSFDNLLKLKVSSIYVAMFDEVDEATAVFPVETFSGALPAEAKMVYLNQDGCHLASDWYLQILKNVEIKH